MLKLVPWRWKESAILPSRGAVRAKMDNLFRRFWVEEPFRSQEGFQFSPAIDISETDDDILVKADIPGVDPKDVDVRCEGGTLTIKGEKKVEKEEKGEGFHRVERWFGSFVSSVALPCPVQEDKIKAEYKDGVLSLRIPKADPEEISQDRLGVPESDEVTHVHQKHTG